MEGLISPGNLKPCGHTLRPKLNTHCSCNASRCYAMLPAHLYLPTT